MSLISCSLVFPAACILNFLSDRASQSIPLWAIHIYAPATTMEPIRAKIITRQPGKAVYALIAFALAACRLPFWMIYFAPRALRQHPRWSWGQALKCHVMKVALHHLSVVEAFTPLSLVSGKDRECYPIVKPGKSELYQGVLRDPEILPATIGGTWYPSPYVSGDSEDIILHLHGGAFVVGDGRKAESAPSALLYRKCANAKSFYPNYRLSSNAGGRFPAALQDCVTAYQYLLGLGIPSSKIVLAGDSAGANLAITLLRYIADHPDLLPAPRAALLWSPWVDIAGSLDPKSIDRNRNEKTDFIPGGLVTWGAKTYTPKFMEASHPYISPLGNPFRTKTSLWVSAGSVEVLRDDDAKLAEEMKGAGNKVDYYEIPFALHDIFYNGQHLGWEKEAEEAAIVAGGWLKNVMM